MAIAFDAATLAAVDDTDVTSITFSHAVASATHRALVVIVWILNEGSSPAPAVTYNGDALAVQETAEAGDVTNAKAYLFFLQNPDVGTANVVVTDDGSGGTPEVYKAIAISVNSSVGAITMGDTATVIEASGTTAPSVTLSPVTANDFLVDGGVGHDSLNPVVGAGQTQRANGTMGPAAGSSYTADFFASTQPGSSGGVMSWTRSGTPGPLAYVAGVLVEAAGGGASVTPATATLTLTTFAPTVTVLSFEQVLSDESDATYVELVSADSPSTFEVTLEEAQQPGPGDGTLTIRAERLEE